MNVFFFMLKGLRQRGIKCKLWFEFAHVLVCLYVSLVVKRIQQRPVVDSPNSMVYSTIVLLPAVLFKRVHLLGLAGSVADKLDPIDGAQGKDKGKM